MIGLNDYTEVWHNDRRYYVSPTPMMFRGVNKPLVLTEVCVKGRAPTMRRVTSQNIIDAVIVKKDDNARIAAL